jgi:CRISPR-associated endonuclease/helicase Cas3
LLKPRYISTGEQSKALELADCLAKTNTTPHGEKVKGIDVFTHCLIVGMVAQELILRQPAWLREKLFPKGSELLAAAHDIGKVSPAFQEMIYRSLKDYVPNSFPGLEQINPEFAKRKGQAFHPFVSQASIVDGSKYIPEILGRHHGASPGSTLPNNAEIYGGTEWQKQRENLLNELKNKLSSDWPHVRDEIHASVLSGLTTVADWIGSGHFFEQSASAESQPLAEKVTQALDSAGFIMPRVNAGLSFSEIFTGFNALPAQTRLIEAATQPGVYVLEAPMGLGKTEAALYAAYNALAENRAIGIYFALPTQLTSDKIHVRMNNFLQKILSADCPRREALLLHGAAWLRDSELGEDGQPGRSWFSSRKRGLLAPFAVGTIDQALMAVMNVKHGFVRTFGLAGKVVILDEVHSYDSYTGTLLENLVKALREIHCTVIILSATLTRERRAVLIGLPVDKLNINIAYPLVSSLPEKGKPGEFGTEKLLDTEVLIKRISSDENAIEEALQRAEERQQVLWIENTVAEAQEMYQVLAARATSFGVEIGLLHSRFIKSDREKKETYWVGIYGKEGKNKRKEKGRILIGTQVLEQSLDIDADFLVTRLCPTDMFLQRIGRLWRHRKDNDPLRPAQAHCEAWLLAPSLDEAMQNYKKAFGKSAFVYSPYVLFRTLEVLENLSRVVIPSRIRELLETTYSERNEHDLLAKLKRELEEEREKLHRFALLGVSSGGVTLPESKASTRYAETESCDVLLIGSVMKKETGTDIKLLDGSCLVLPGRAKAKGYKAWHDLAATLVKNTVSVPEKQAPAFLPISELAWLEDYVYLGDEDDCPFRVAIVKDSDEIIGLKTETARAGYKLSYNSDTGYRAVKTAKDSNMEDGW